MLMSVRLLRHAERKVEKNEKGGCVAETLHFYSYVHSTGSREERVKIMKERKEDGGKRYGWEDEEGTQPKMGGEGGREEMGRRGKRG